MVKCTGMVEYRKRYYSAEFGVVFSDIILFFCKEIHPQTSLWVPQNEITDLEMWKCYLNGEITMIIKPYCITKNLCEYYIDELYSIDKKYIKETLEIAGLPKSKIYIVFCNYLLREKELGHTQFTKFDNKPHYGNINKDIFDNTDCTIYISKRICEMQQEMPAYFVYILGHELGHTIIVLSDQTTYPKVLVIQASCLEIKKLSNGKFQYIFQDPTERRCDQFSLSIIEKLSLRQQFNYECDVLINEPDCPQKNYLKLLKIIESKDNMDGLYNELIEFILPYKEQLIEYWEKNKNEYPFKFIRDYNEIFKKY